MTTYLGTLSSDALVIVGTNYAHNAEAQLNTTAIGGTDYTKNYNSSNFPNGYMAIGAAPGSAYENYYTNSVFRVNPFATGMLVEDVNGNYNFQSSGAIEYTVSPNDPNFPGQSTVTLINTPFGFTYPRTVYISPAGQTNGYWLLELQRADLYTIGACNPVAVDPDRKESHLTNCGTFYPTGAKSPATATRAYQSLSGALNAVTSDELVFLVTVGEAGYAANQSSFDVANTSYMDGNGVTQYAYYNEFGPALESVGGPPGHNSLTVYAGQ